MTKSMRPSLAAVVLCAVLGVLATQKNSSCTNPEPEPIKEVPTKEVPIRGPSIKEPVISPVVDALPYEQKTLNAAWRKACFTATSDFFTELYDNAEERSFDAGTYAKAAVNFRNLAHGNNPSETSSPWGVTRVANQIPTREEKTPCATFAKDYMLVYKNGFVTPH